MKEKQIRHSPLTQISVVVLQPEFGHQERGDDPIPGTLNGSDNRNNFNDTFNVHQLREIRLDVEDCPFEIRRRAFEQEQFLDGAGMLLFR